MQFSLSDELEQLVDSFHQMLLGAREPPAASLNDRVALIHESHFVAQLDLPIQHFEFQILAALWSFMLYGADSDGVVAL